MESLIHSSTQPRIRLEKAGNLNLNAKNIFKFIRKYDGLTTRRFIQIMQVTILLEAVMVATNLLV